MYILASAEIYTLWQLAETFGLDFEVGDMDGKSRVVVPRGESRIGQRELAAIVSGIRAADPSRKFICLLDTRKSQRVFVFSFDK